MTSSRPLQVSWSSLKRWESCHQLDYRAQRRETKAVTDGRIFLPGTIADRVMRAWLESDDPQPGQMLAMVEEYFRRYAHPETEEEKKEAQYVIKWRGDKRSDQREVIEFVEKVVTELEPVLLEHVIPHDYHPELKFRATVGLPLFGVVTPVVLHGGIDIATRLRSGGEPTESYQLFDLKATVNKSYISATMGQGIFYDIAFGHWIGNKAQPERFGFIAPALPEKIYWAEITNDDRRFMLQRVIKYAEGLLREDKTPKESNSGCEYCEAAHVCDKWKLKSQLDAQGKNRASFGQTAASRRTEEQRRKLEETTDV